MKINELVKEAYDNAVEKGWHESPRSALEVHMLIVSEIAEATEEVRKDTPSIYQLREFGHSQIDAGRFSAYELNDKIRPNEEWDIKYPPEGEAIELADAVIRIADYFGERGWNLEETIKLKMAYNKTRGYRHGGKKV